MLCVSSCANKVTPSGGEKDIVPPKVVSSSPENFSKNFSQKEISIDFDEYIELVDLNKQLIISPLINPAPEISANKKTVKIKFEQPLTENTTYTFNFGSAIADVHEKNTFENFQFVFSTGSFLDSLSISGKIENAENLKTEKGILVMLYKSNEDSAPLKNPPDYFAKTDEAGNYKISNIGSGAYRIFALKDKNSNYLFDQPDEEIGFVSSQIVIGDSAKADLKLFKSIPEKIRLKSATVEEQGKLKIIFNSRAENVMMHSVGLEKNPWQLEEYSINKDTVVLWMTDTTLDSLKIIFLQNEQPFDTTFFSLKKKSGGKGANGKVAFLTSTAQSGWLDAGKEVPLLFSHPVSTINESKIIFKVDSIEVTGVAFFFSDSVKRNLVLKYDWQENKNYEFTFLPGAFNDIFNSENDTIKITFKLKQATEYGSVVLKLKTEKTDANYIVQIVNDKDEVIRQKITPASDNINFDFLYPGSYRYRIIYDENKNNRWDTGNYLQKVQPEKVIYYNEPVTIRANWDLESEWQL